jgi:hypothetical protein
MMRLLHLVAISVLIGSAAYVYTIKYDTLYYAEEVVKLRRKIEREGEAIAIAKAEWALLTRPDRLQRLVEQNLDLVPMTVAQLGKLSDLPQRPAKADAIGMKLEALIREPTATPKDRRPGDARTPTTTGSLPKAAVR